MAGLFTLLVPFGLAAPLPAFPGAEGFGAAATGGRGGRVLHVTTLAESGPGSLRAALEAEGPRVVVFDVSGVIDLGEADCSDPFAEDDASNVLVIRHGDVTVAGQTAPGAGITLRGRLYTEYDERVGNVIVRHLRIRPAPYDCADGGDQMDALRFAVNTLGMFDHVSVSWGVDENVDTYQGTRLTLQWSIVGEGATTGHPEGEHNYGMLNDAGRVSVLHDLFAHDQNRNPALAVGPAESSGNVAYDVRHGFVNHNRARGDFNLVGNTFVRGPSDELHPFFFDGGTGAAYHVADTAVDDPGRLVGTVDDPWSEPYFTLGVGPGVRAPARFDFSGEPGWVAPTVTRAEEARVAVLAQAGAFPRDVVDARMVADVQARTGGWGARQVDDLLEGLHPTAPPADADGDGMPDAFEEDHGLDPDDAGDAWTPLDGGWPALEVYLQCRADALLEPSATCGDAQPQGGGPGGGCDTAGGGGTWLAALVAALVGRRRVWALAVPVGVALVGCEEVGGKAGATGDSGAPLEPGSALVTYGVGDRVFLRGVREDDAPIDVSAEVGRGGRDRWLVPSPSATWFVVSTERDDGEILVRLSGDRAEVEEVRPGGAAVYLEGMAAISDDGDTVVFPTSGGPNAIDLFVTRRDPSGSWSPATVLTAASPRPNNNQPAWTRDGAGVVFNCGAERDPESGGNDACSVSLEGGAVDVLVAHDTLPDGRNDYVNFPRDAGGGRLVFEGSWPIGGGQPPETLWERRRDADPVPAVSRALDNTVSPCVLGDGSLVALWLGRPGGDGVHELTWVGGGDPVTLTPDVDVADVGIGCTTR
jgi:hypothetical protein